jgi:hypothetical protein
MLLSSCLAFCVYLCVFRIDKSFFNLCSSLITVGREVSSQRILRTCATLNPSWSTLFLVGNLAYDFTKCFSFEIFQRPVGTAAEKNRNGDTNLLC